MAAKGYIETDRQVRNILEDVSNGIFKSVYLLMGEEPYYPDLVCDAIIRNCLQEWEKDFNETVCYGADVDADTVITAARRFPMMAERQLVVVKEAQAMKSLEDLALYCQKPLDSTVLVILMHGASADKRRSLYKTVLKTGVIVESNALRDYEMAQWIADYYRGRGLEIEPEAAALLGESAGTDLSKIAVETGKLLKNLPEGTTLIRTEDIEKNVGISRQFSVFELTRALSYKDAPKALRIAGFIGNAPKFAMPMAVSALFTHFYRILKYAALLQGDRNPDAGAKAKVLGVNPYFFKEYDAALRNYPMRSCMAVISLLDDYDYKGKGGETGEAAPGDLLVELVTKILNI
ncbi:MAG: DNA polymerase III subunit delta [Bacteroidales bacterium]|nr:DNA polymerase III subunit delta [Bacteroidales bacterium]